LALVFVVCCVGRGLCDGLITRSEETYRVCVCGLETSTMRQSERELDYCATEKNPVNNVERNSRCPGRDIT